MIVNRNRYVRIAQTERSENDLVNAEFANIDEQIEASKKIAAYEFKADKDLTEKLSKFGALHISVFTDKNGKDRNKGTFTNNVEVSIYGTNKEVLPEMDIVSDKIARAVFGYCFSGDEIVFDLKEIKGTPKKVRRMYLNMESVK